MDKYIISVSTEWLCHHPKFRKRSQEGYSYENIERAPHTGLLEGWKGKDERVYFTCKNRELEESINYLMQGLDSHADIKIQEGRIENLPEDLRDLVGKLENFAKSKS